MLAVVKAFAATLTGKLFLVGVAATAIDPAWAIPINTFLLLIIAIIQGATHGRVKMTQQDVQHAANAAASAANAAADAARITKEIGGAVREVRTPVIPPIGGTQQ